MPQGGYNPLTKDDLKERLKEIQGRIQQWDRRERAYGDLKKWLAARKLDYSDLVLMMRKMKPQRADKPVKSKKPLQPERDTGFMMKAGKKVPRVGDPDFRRAIQAARLKQSLTKEDVGKKIGVSGASISNWEQGRNVPLNDKRLKILKVLGLPAGLGAEATAALREAQLRGGRLPNGQAHA